MSVITESTNAVLFLVLLIHLQAIRRSEMLEVVEPSEEYRSYKGHQLLRIIPSQSEDVEKLKSIERDESMKIDFWQRPTTAKRNVDFLVAPEDQAEVKDMLIKTGLQMAVVSDDIQKFIDEEMEKRFEHVWNKRSTPSNRLHKYQNFNSIMMWLEESKTKCQFCDIINIGKSSEGRDLKVMKITKSRRRKPAIFIDAGFHAREWIAPVTALNFIGALINNSDPVISFLTNEYVWYIMPLANPDGYVYSWTKDRLWRKTRSKNEDPNCPGTDLNRNWDFYWGGEGTSRNSCRENFCGSRPFSEPESRSIADFIMGRSNDLTIYLSLHSYGQLILAPWGHTTQVPNDFYDLLIRGTEAAEAMRKTTGAKYTVGSTGRMLYLASGASDDWVKGVAKVKYSFTIELRDLGNRGFLLPESEIPDTSLEVTNGIVKMSLDVLRELKRFGSKNAVVFKESETNNIEHEPPEPLAPSDWGGQESQNWMRESVGIGPSDLGITSGMEETSKNGGHSNESMMLKYGENESKLDANKRVKTILDETMKRQRSKQRLLMKQLQEEIKRQDSKHQIARKILDSLITHMKARIHSNNVALY